MADYFNYQKSPKKEPRESDTFGQIFSPVNSKSSFDHEKKFNINIKEDLKDKKNLNGMENKYDLEDKNFINQLKSNNELLFKGTR